MSDRAASQHPGERRTVGREERWRVAGLLALATALYVVAWLFGGPATFPDLPDPPTEPSPAARQS